jgi:hypothetical protein
MKTLPFIRKSHSDNTKKSRRRQSTIRAVGVQYFALLSFTGTGREALTGFAVFSTIEVPYDG